MWYVMEGYLPSSPNTNIAYLDYKYGDKVNSPLADYRELQKELANVRRINEDRESEAENYILLKMERIWPDLSNEDLELLEALPKDV